MTNAVDWDDEVEAAPKPKPGEQWIEIATGELFVINVAGYAESADGTTTIPPDKVMELCLPYEHEEAKKPLSAGSESKSSQTSTPADAELKQQEIASANDYERLKEWGAQVNANEDMVAYVMRKYGKKSHEERVQKLTELADSLDEHPVWAAIFGQITANTVEDIGDMDKRLTADLERYKQQYQARCARANADIEFIDGVLLPKITVWAKEELKKNKSKGQYMDFASCRLQLHTTKPQFLLEPEHAPTGDSVVFFDQKELDDWFVKSEQVVTTLVHIDLEKAKQKALAIHDQAMALDRDGKPKEAQALLDTIPQWLKYKDEETTASFTVAPKPRKK